MAELMLHVAKRIAPRCDGRYKVPGRAEPFEVTYRCLLDAGHSGPCGSAPSVERVEALELSDEDLSLVEYRRRFEAALAAWAAGSRLGA